MKIIRKTATLVIAMAMTMALCACTNNEESSEKTSFQYWNEGAASLEAICAYVEDVSNEESENFIPEEDRIAVFDMDGTLYGEKAPVYIEEILYMHRVLDDPTFKAPDELVEYGNAMKKAADEGASFDDSEFADYNAKAFAGMTMEEFDKYVKDFISTTDAEGFTGLTYAEAIFKPMAEIVDYLNENGFTTYICSGTDRATCRAILDGHVNIQPNHIIGCDVAFFPDDYHGSVLDFYEYTYDNKLVRSDVVTSECWEGAKVDRIAVEIGKQPVMAFGNSNGDAPMSTYVTDENPYKSMAVMLNANDDERDYNNVAEYEKRAKTWLENGWTVISMKDDWKTIYGDGVEKTK